MLTVAVVVAALGWAHWLGDDIEWPGETVWLPLYTGVITVLYLAALAGLLAPTASALVAAGCIVAVRQLRRVFRGVSRAPTPTAGVGVFAAATALVAWQLRDAAFIGWDEFSHWGLASKLVHDGHGLPGVDSPLVFPDYPPASALFHYVATLGHSFSEPGAYVAHAVLATAALAAMCARRPVWLALVVFLFGFAALYTFGRGFQSLDVDHLLGLLFGGGLGSYYIWDDKGRVARLVPVVFVLPLLKPIGLLLAFFAVGAVVSDQWFEGRPGRRRGLVLVALTLAPLVAAASWATHVRSTGARPAFRVQASLTGIAAAFSSSSPRVRQTVGAFSDALTTSPVGPDRISVAEGDGPRTDTVVPTRTWLLAFGVVGVAFGVAQRGRRSRWRWAVSQSWMAACAATYLGALLFLYLFAFGEYEGVRLVSFGRYVGTLLLGLALVTLAWGIVTAQDAGRRRMGATGVIVLMAAGMFAVAPVDARRFAVGGALPVQPIRAQVREAVAPALRHVPVDKRVYLVATGTIGLEFYMARYELAPRLTNLSCWSVGAPRFDGDVWTCPLSVADWAERLNAYDYVVLGLTDEQFWAAYGSLFEGGRGRVLFERADQGHFRPVRD